MKLKIIIPVIPSKGLKNIKENIGEEIASLNIPEDVEYDLEMLEKGTASLEGHYDETINGPEVIGVAEKAEKDNFDAVIVDCFAGPGVYGAREKLEIPVIHPGETSIHLASLIGRDFAIIDILEETAHTINDLVRRCGLSNNYISRNYVDMPVLDMEEDLEKLISKTESASIKCIEEGANVIVFGCTGMMKVADKLEDKLNKIGINVPVIEPFRTSVFQSIMLVNMNLSQSKRAYPFPRDKPRDLR